MRIFLFALFLHSSVWGEFHPPNPGAILFRRSALPLDQDRQRELSSLLVKVVFRPSWDESEEQHRASAQLLSLARQIAPQSEEWQEAQESLTAGKLEPPYSAKERLGILMQLEKFVLFLLEQERGSEGYHLAELILDPLAVIAPGLPVTTLQNFLGEKKRWEGALAR